MDLLLPVFQLIYFVAHFLYSLAENVNNTLRFLWGKTYGLLQYQNTRTATQTQTQTKDSGTKRPKHVGIISGFSLVEPGAMAALIGWTASYGVPEVSIYDVYGDLPAKKAAILKELDKLDLGYCFRVKERKREGERIVSDCDENMAKKSEKCENLPKSKENVTEKHENLPKSNENIPKKWEKSEKETVVGVNIIKTPENSPSVLRHRGHNAGKGTNSIHTNRTEQKHTEKADNLTEKTEKLTEKPDKLTEKVDNLTEKAEKLTEMAGNASEMAGNASDMAGNASDMAGNASDMAGNASDMAGNASETLKTLRKTAEYTDSTAAEKVLSENSTYNTGTHKPLQNTTTSDTITRESVLPVVTLTFLELRDGRHHLASLAETLAAALKHANTTNTTQNGRQMTHDGRENKPDGHQMTQNGRQNKPDDRQNIPDGHQMIPDGRQMTQDGRQSTQNDYQMKQDGRQMTQDGGQMKQDGRQMKQDGGQMTQDGRQNKEDSESLQRSKRDQLDLIKDFESLKKLKNEDLGLIENVVSLKKLPKEAIGLEQDCEGLGVLERENLDLGKDFEGLEKQKKEHLGLVKDFEDLEMLKRENLDLGKDFEGLIKLKRENVGLVKDFEGLKKQKTDNLDLGKYCIGLEILSKSSASPLPTRGEICHLISNALMTDPDLVISLGNTNTLSTLGFPPWHLRLSEIHSLRLCDGFLGLRYIMEAYARCEQRCGR